MANNLNHGSLRKQYGFAAIVGAVLPFMASQVGFIMNPALASFADLFPDLSYSTITYLATLPSLICIPFNLIAGNIAGKKVKYKTLTLLAIALIIIGGIAPFFFTNFIGWCICRCILGIGMGLVMPLGGALVASMFEGKKAVQMQGVGTIVLNMSGVALQLVSGWLVGYNVNYAWLLHGALLIVFIMVWIFLPEPEKIEDETSASATGTISGGSKISMPISVWLFSVSFGFLFMFCYTLIMNMSKIVIGENLGTTAVVGTITALFTVGGIVAGVMFAALHRLLSKWLIPVMCILIVFSLLLGYFGSNIAMLMAASFFTGVGTFVVWPACINEFGEICQPEQISLASGIFMAVLNIGCFLASAYNGIVGKFMGDNPRYPVIVGAFAMAVITIPWFIGRIGQKANEY